MHECNLLDSQTFNIIILFHAVRLGQDNNFRLGLCRHVHSSRAAGDPTKMADCARALGHSEQTSKRWYDLTRGLEQMERWSLQIESDLLEGLDISAHTATPSTSNTSSAQTPLTSNFASFTPSQTYDITFDGFLCGRMYPNIDCGRFTLTSSLGEEHHVGICRFSPL